MMRRHIGSGWDASVANAGLAAAIITTGIIATAAIAADMPVKASAPPLPYAWSGFYLGANAGYGVGRNQSAFGPATMIFPEATTQQPHGTFGGLQAGVNWQAANWVLGLEADFQLSAQKDATCQALCNIPPGAVVLNQLAVEQSMPWFATARARLGYAVGSVMPYVTGGVAWGRVENTINVTQDGVAAPPVGIAETRAGWTIGSGVEAALDGNWTAKVEYLYLNLGEISRSYTAAGFAHTWRADLHNHVFRAGVNYRLGAPGSTRLPAAANWAGLYLGGSAGAGLAQNATATSTTIIADVYYLERLNLAPRGVFGGVLAGYNWQVGSWVYGVEADFQLANQRDAQTCAMGCNPLTDTFTAIGQTLNWFGTARGRIGVTSGGALIYTTAGFAYGHVTETISQSIFGAPSGSYRFSHSKAGWTAGGGIEHTVDPFGMLGPNWTARTEYLYIDLGSVRDSYTYLNLPNTVDVELRNHVWRSALTYRFGVR